MSFVAASDEYYRWYMAESHDGHPNPGWYHHCKGDYMQCNVHRATGEPHLHFVRIRIINLYDLKERSVEWFRQL